MQHFGEKNPQKDATAMCLQTALLDVISECVCVFYFLHNLERQLRGCIKW